MLRLRTEITIADTTFNKVINIQVDSSWKDLVDTCRIELPNKFKRNNKTITVGDDGFFKRGDSVTVKAGYFPKLTTIFEGYIRRIYVDTVLVIEAEDEAFQLKQKTVTESVKDSTLENLINKIKGNVSAQSVDAKIGSFRATRVTPLQVLEELRKTYGLISYIRNKVLRVGLAYYTDEGNTVKFNTEKNVIDTSNMEFIDNGELLITVKGISWQRDNTIIERYAYYLDGEIVISDEDPAQGETDTLSIPNLTQSTLDEFIKNRLELRISTGIRGGFTAFLEPDVNHGDKVQITSKKFPEREGTYLVKRVVKNAGISGGTQEIELDIKVA